MSETLNQIERRVLGVLMEKALAQPRYYPMTLNAVVAACNQKSNRDPVMALDEECVWDTLERLRAVGLVSRILPGGASRVERFRHEVKNLLGWEKPQRAVMSELMLRGPQTVGELRGHCSRLYPFENTEAVAAVLEILSNADPQRAAVLPRAPGRSAVRWAHRLYEEDEWATLTASSEPAAAPPRTMAVESAPGSAAPVCASSSESLGVSSADVDRLREELENLHAEIAKLHESVAELRRRLEHLEQ